MHQLGCANHHWTLPSTVFLLWCLPDAHLHIFSSPLCTGADCYTEVFGQIGEPLPKPMKSSDIILFVAIQLSAEKPPQCTE